MSHSALAIGRTIIVLFVLILTFFSVVRAQVVEPVTPGSSIPSNDSLNADPAFLNSPLRSFNVSDSLEKTVRNMKVTHSISFFKYWSDQFPSSIIGYIYGLSAEKDYELLRKEKSDDWKFYLSLILVGMLSLIRFGYSKEFDELFYVFKNLGPSQQMYRELGTGVSFGTVLLNLFAVIVFSFYVFLLFSHFGTVQREQVWMMVFSVLVVLVFLSVRYLSLKIASVLLPFRKEITLFNFYEIQINRTMGVAIFPLLLLITFSKYPVDEYALYFSFLVTFVFFFLRYLKGFNIGSNYFGRDLFHFLLYICALEIAPVLIIIRVLLNLGSPGFSL